MKYRIIIRPESEKDLLEAFSWYEDKRYGLGHDFLLQFEAGLSFIQRNPKIYPSEYKGTRRHLTKRFPYKIIYWIECDNIIILAVIHNKRNPDIIKNIIDYRNEEKT